MRRNARLSALCLARSYSESEPGTQLKTILIFAPRASKLYELKCEPLTEKKAISEGISAG